MKKVTDRVFCIQNITHPYMQVNFVISEGFSCGIIILDIVALAERRSVFAQISRIRI